MERSPVRDLVVGLFVLAGAGAIAYLSLSGGGFTWHGHGGLSLSAGFDQTRGLTVRTPVVIAGVRVGEVSAIAMDKNSRARLDMNLDPTLKLPADTSASIVTPGVLVDRYIELQPGGEESLLKSSDLINFTNQQSSSNG